VTQTQPLDSAGATPDFDDSTRWRVHGQRPLYECEWIKLYMTDVELPDGDRFEHHTVWMPTAAMTAVLNDEQTHVLLMWRHRLVPDLWTWELPGGLVDEGEEPPARSASSRMASTGP
jgi:hypothetical protein